MLPSLSYTNEVPLEIYNVLFKDIMNEDMSVKELDFTLEAINMAVNKGIDCSNPFKLKGYIHNAHVRNKMAEQRKAKKTLHLYSENDSDFEISYGVCESTISDGTDVYEDLILEDELHYTLIKLKKLYVDILVSYKVELWGCLENAKRGITPAVQKLKELCEEDIQINELVFVLLSSNRSIEELKEIYEAL